MPIKKLSPKKKNSPEINSPKISVTLPTEMSKPVANLQKYITLLYGEKKIGKTTLTSKFPSSIHLMFEPGGKSLKIYQRPVSSWKEFKAYVTLLEKDEKFETIVIDTIDIAYNLCLDYVCDKLVISHPSDEGYGKGWKAVKDEFSKELLRLSNIGKGVFFISHSRDEEIEKRDGGKYHKIIPTVPGQARELLEGMVDIWCFYGYDGDDRYLWIQGNDHIGAGNRIEGRFISKKGNPIKKIYMGSSAEEAHSNFMKAFNNEYVNPVSKHK